jgi:hypothetical protein
LSLYEQGSEEWRQGLPSTTSREAVRWAVVALSSFEVFFCGRYRYLRPAVGSLSQEDRLVAMEESLMQGSRWLCTLMEQDVGIPGDLLDLDSVSL